MLTIGLAGKGRWGQNIERTLAEMSDVRIVLVGRGEVPQDLDGVIVATPSTTHASVALPFIERGIPTFIEKPMAASVSDAKAIRDTARKYGTPIFVGHIQLYNPAFRAVLSALPSIGTITNIEAEGTSSTPRTDGSVLWDWLPHHLAMAREVMGRMPDSVSVVVEEGKRAEDSARVTFLFGSIPFISHVSWITEERRRTFTVYGSEGIIFFDDAQKQKVKVVVRDKEIFPEYDAESPLTRELQAFCDMVRTRTPDRPHIQEGLDIVRSIEAAHAAAQDGAAHALVP